MEKEKHTYHVFNQLERVAIVYAHDVQHGTEGDLYFYEWEWVDGDKLANLIARIPAGAYSRFDGINRTVPSNE